MYQEVQERLKSRPRCKATADVCIHARTAHETMDYSRCTLRLSTALRLEITFGSRALLRDNWRCKRIIGGLRSGMRDVATPVPPASRRRTGMPSEPLAQTIRYRHLVTPARPRATASAGIKVRFHV